MRENSALRFSIAANRLLLTSLTLLLAGALEAHAGPTFDSSFLQPKESKDQGKKTTTETAPKTRRGFGIEKPREATDATAKISYETLESFTQLLKNLPAGVPRNTLLLNRAAAMSLYARKKHLASKNPVLSENLKKYFQAAIRDAEAVLASPFRTAEQVKKIHHLIGYSYIYLEQPREARPHLIEVLRLNPDSSNIGWAVLYIAEDLFDAGKYTEAEKYYSNYLKQMTPQEQELANYKLAWCYINLTRMKEAEDILTRLALTDSKQGLGRDSLRDLAYLITHQKNPDPAISAKEAEFVKVSDKIEFLSTVRANLETQNLADIHSKVVLRLLELERNNEQRLIYLLADLRVHEKRFADRESALIFSKIDTQIRQSRMTAASPELLKHSTTIETQTVALIRAFIDTYAGRIKTPEKIEKPELLLELKRQFRFFVEYLLESKQRSRIADLWLDVCLDAEDWEGVDEVTQTILRDKPRLGTFFEKAYISQLAALEKLPTDPPHVTRRQQRVKEFVDLFPNSPQWIRVARLYAQSEVEKGHDKDVLPLLEKIHLREPSKDSYYRLQFSRFKAGEYAAILEDKNGAQFSPPEPRLADLLRESALALAQDARKRDKIPDYVRYIHKFLDLQPSEQKALIARQDYFSVLIEKEREDDATKEFLSLPGSIKGAPALSQTRLKLWQLNMKKDRYFEASEISREVGVAKMDPALAYRNILANLALGNSVRIELLRVLTPQNRTYILGLLALLRPANAIEIFRQSSPQGEAETELAALAFRVQSGKWDLIHTPERAAILGRNFAFSNPSADRALPCESRIDKVKFPGPDAKPATLNRLLPKIVEETRKIRQSVSKEIQGKEPTTQLRAVEKARDLETRVAQTILKSPLPAVKLTEEQRTQYEEGLKTAAQEFEAQAAEFEKIAAGLREIMIKRKVEADARVLPAPDMKKWNWPAVYDSNGFTSVVKAVKAGNPVGALTLLDFLKEGTIKDEADYYRIRTGILLGASTPDPVRIYLLAELENAKQNELIQEWRQLVLGVQK